MSWSDYVSGYLVNYTDQNNGKTASNVVEHGAIVGNTDGTVWASTSGFELSTYSTDIEQDDGTTKTVEVNEFANMLDAFNNKGATSKAGGVRIHKEKYYMVSFDSDREVMYLKKSGGGAAVAKSNLAFVIATFNTKLKSKGLSGAEEPQNPGLVNRAAEDLQTFLKTNNL
jgi:hypothetical protein